MFGASRMWWVLGSVLGRAWTVDAAAASYAGGKKSIYELEYQMFPQRQPFEAAVIEWGSSAIISALDAAVASFGPQTSLGAFFEVEASPVLADPVDGVGADLPEDLQDFDVHQLELKQLNNAEEIRGNMAVMTNGAGLSGIQLTKVAQLSGAAALAVVNVDHDYPDYIYSMDTDNDEEEQYVLDGNVDIPVVMISLNSGSLLTTANHDEAASQGDAPPPEPEETSLPDRVRLYAAGDRPFFEEVTPSEPVVYLIHNLLTEKECDDLVALAQGKLDPVDDTLSNVLENTVAAVDGKPRANKIERVTLWMGLLAGRLWKQVDERIDQVTGYPSDHFSEWQINKHVQGSHHAPHHDHHSTELPVATITVFLTDVADDATAGGQLVYPSPGSKDEYPVMVRLRKGLGVVHHNTIENNSKYDVSSLHAEMEYLESEKPKYIARRWVYANPVSRSRRTILPLLALPLGMKLPRFVVGVFDSFIHRFGSVKGSDYFDKACVAVAVGLLFGIASLINSVVWWVIRLGSGSTKNTDKEADKKKKTNSTKKRKSANASTTAPKKETKKTK